MVIHLQGPDTYRSQQRFRQLRDAFRTKHDPSGLNTLVLDGQSLTAEELRTAVTTVGFFSTKRFLGINHYVSIAAGCPPEVLAEILQPVAGQADVVVVIREVTNPASPRAGRRPAAVKSKSLKIRQATVETFAPWPEAKRRAWVSQFAKECGGTISPAAADQLLEWCGDDGWRLESEVAKLVAYAGNQVVTPAMVKQLVRAPEVSDVFALTDALGRRQTAAALGYLQRELEAGTHPLAVVSLLITHLRNLLLVQAAEATGQPTTHLAAALKLHPYVVRKALEQSRAFPREVLRRWYHQLIEIDATLKSTKLDPETLLDQLLVRG